MQTGSIHFLSSTAGDVALMRRMLDLFGRAFEDVDRFSSQQPGDAYLAQLLGNDLFIALVSRAGDEVVGGLAGYVLPKYEQQRSEFYIYDIAVAESHRRQGIATALIRALQARVAERGIDVIYVQADADDAPAIALYTKLGIAAQVLHFDILPAA